MSSVKVYFTAHSHFSPAQRCLPHPSFSPHISHMMKRNIPYHRPVLNHYVDIVLISTLIWITSISPSVYIVAKHLVALLIFAYPSSIWTNDNEVGTTDEFWTGAADHREISKCIYRMCVLFAFYLLIELLLLLGLRVAVLNPLRRLVAIHLIKRLRTKWSALLTSSILSTNTYERSFPLI